MLAAWPVVLLSSASRCSPRLTEVRASSLKSATTSSTSESASSDTRLRFPVLPASFSLIILPSAKATSEILHLYNADYDEGS